MEEVVRLRSTNKKHNYKINSLEVTESSITPIILIDWISEI